MPPAFGVMLKIEEKMISVAYGGKGGESHGPVSKAFSKLGRKQKTLDKRKIWRYDMKKMTSMLLALVLCLALCVPAFATEQQTISEADLGAPIEVVHTVDEQGNEITERIYFVPDAGTFSLRSASGSGWLYKFKDVLYKEDGALKYATVFAGGYFTWGNDKVTVRDACGGFESASKPTIGECSGSVTDYGDSGGIFQANAFVTWGYTMRIGVIVSTGSVELKVDKSGNVK